MSYEASENLSKKERIWWLKRLMKELEEEKKHFEKMKRKWR